jgi:aldose 1-epimerase
VTALRVLENDVWQVGLLPETGMSTAFGRVKRAGGTLDFFRPTPEGAYGKASDCASFLLVPWSNRVKDGKLVFRGREYRLGINAVDGSAIHGFGRDYPWQIESADGARLVASFDSRRHDARGFPFAFTSRAEFRLDGASFSVRLGVKNEGRETMPAGFGHHPYFRRAIAGANDAVRLEIPCGERFELEACIPKGAPVPVDARLDFRAMRPLDPATKLDDCLTGRVAGAPIRFAYPASKLDISLELDPPFENVVIYVPDDKTYFAVEPVTNANDGFNLHARGVRGAGIFELEPGEERAASIAWRVAG